MKLPRTIASRVFLRSPIKSDAAEFIALNCASKAFHSGLVSPPRTLEQFNALLQKSNEDTSVCRLVCLKPNDAIIGAINLSQIFRGGFQNAYLGYYMGAQYSGQGYMTQALELTLKHAFEYLKLHRLEANIQPGNLASIALVKRAGFLKEGFSRRYLKLGGRWRDHERWAIIAEDWKRRHSCK
jgi:ribosomal-protein-alanine N-acetyltransferase